MIDYMIRGMERTGKFRVFSLNSTNACEEMRKIHESSAPSTAAMGRILSASVMLGSMMKDRTNSLTVRINGGGPIGTVTCVANNGGDVKITATNPKAQSEDYPNGKLNVAGVIGTQGNLSVIKDLGLKEPVIGISELVSGEIAEDFSAYFFNSEQKPSVVALGVLVNTDLSVIASGGYILQLMPGCPDSEIETIEEAVKKSRHTTDLIKDLEKPEEVIKTVFPMYDFDFFDKLAINYRCDCSEERVERMIKSLGKKEIKSMIEEDHGAEVVCHFCGKRYNYSEENLKELVAEIE